MNLSGKPRKKKAISWRTEWESTREWTSSEEDLRAEEEKDRDKAEDENGWDAKEVAT